MHKTVNIPMNHKTFVQSEELNNYINKYPISSEMVVKNVNWPELEEMLAYSVTLKG